MKKVAVNTRLLLKGRLEGLGTFEYEVLKRLVQQHPEVEFHFIFDRPYDESFIFGPNVVPHVLFPQARHPFLFIWWFDYSLPSLLKKIKPEVFFSPDGYLSLRTDVPQIPVLHDINFYHYPHYFPFWVRWHYNTWFPQFAKKAVKIITVSEFCKKDIATSYRVEADKIYVAYNGVDQTSLQVTDEQLKSIQKKYKIEKPYFIFVGALYPRKNLENQLKAFDKFKSVTGSNMQFIIIGNSYPESEPIFETWRMMKHQQDVKFLGRVEPREDVDILLHGATACSYVSNFEGFGLPILEAMRAGTAVVTSNISALPEVAGDAAILVDPSSPGEIANAYHEIFSNAALQQQLITKGYAQLQQFTWDETAKRVGEVLGM